MLRAVTPQHSFANNQSSVDFINGLLEVRMYARVGWGGGGETGGRGISLGGARSIRMSPRTARREVGLGCRRDAVHSAAHRPCLPCLTQYMLGEGACMEWVVRIGLKPGHDRLAHLLTCFFTLCTCCTRNLQGACSSSRWGLWVMASCCLLLPRLS